MTLTEPVYSTHGTVGTVGTAMQAGNEGEVVADNDVTLLGNTYCFCAKHKLTALLC